MINPFACLFTLIHVFNTGVFSQVSQYDAFNTRKTVYYQQRDGRFIKSQEESATKTDATDQMLMHYPIGHLTPGPPPTPVGPKVKVIHTNALIQNLRNGTRLGDLSYDKADQLSIAYPWNPIFAESPTVMRGDSVRAAKTIDQVIEKTVDKTGRRPSQHPTEQGQIITELDIIMTREQYLYYYGGRNQFQRAAIQRSYKTGGRFKRKALKMEFTYWPNGLIPYTVDTSFSPAERALLHDSMSDWMDRTCIRFIPDRTDNNDVLQIKNGQGCNSFVGRVGGTQSLNLEPACRAKHVMTHELGHVIGLIHEHQRPDRDQYIRVEQNNVGPGRAKNFNKFATDRINVYGVEYDYTSIMHYGKTAFSKDDKSTTMITRDYNFQEIIGTTSKVSFKDAKLVNAMYKCAGHCRRKPNCGIGFVDKNCRCVCPDGTQSCSSRQLRAFSQTRDRSRVDFSRSRARNQRRNTPNQGLQRNLQNIRNQQNRNNFRRTDNRVVRGNGQGSSQVRNVPLQNKLSALFRRVQGLLRSKGTTNTGFNRQQRRTSNTRTQGQRQRVSPTRVQLTGAQLQQLVRRFDPNFNNAVRLRPSRSG